MVTDYSKDFSGARRAGWHAILLNRYGEQEKADEWVSNVWMSFFQLSRGYFLRSLALTQLLRTGKEKARRHYLG